MTIDTAATDHLLSTTRAVRRRLDLDRPVEKSVILDCLRLAVQAPTGGNSQTWRWLVVTDPDKKAELARMYTEAGGEYLKASAAGATDPQTRRVYESAVYLSRDPGPGPRPRHPLHPGADRQRSQRPWPRPCTARSSRRPGASCWPCGAEDSARSGPRLHLYKEKEAADLLGIPEDITQVALIPVGYTTGGDFKPASRPPVEGITYWDTWGSTE